MVPQYLHDKITCNDNVHTYCTRSGKDLHVTKPNTAYYARRFEVSGTLAYNNLPNHIKQQPSLNQFKTFNLYIILLLLLFYYFSLYIVLI